MAKVSAFNFLKVNPASRFPKENNHVVNVSTILLINHHVRGGLTDMELASSLTRILAWVMPRFSRSELDLLPA
jgi:hypothetical protein